MKTSLVDVIFFGVVITSLLSVIACGGAYLFVAIRGMMQ